MQLLLRIFRFCNPQRKLRKPSTNVYLAGVPGINVVSALLFCLCYNFIDYFFFVTHNSAKAVI